MIEVDKNSFASRGVGGAALGTGIAGLSLGVLNAIGNGGITGLFGGWGNCNANGCSANMPVTRYELGLEKDNAAKDAEISLLKANTYGDQKLLEVYKYFDGQLKEVRDSLCAQAVTNQKTADSFALAAADLAAVKSDLCNRIQLEAERRCCADNAIVTYANATFYPKMVADVTVGTTTTAQTLYNPIPDCGCSCGK